jgi:predicted acetyltransferase
MADVHIVVATTDERPIIANLMQLYMHDFSEILAGSALADRTVIGSDGRFADYPLDGWWRDAGHIPLLIRADGRLAGFALLNVRGHSGLAADHNMAEFFIARAFRRSGVGKAAAHAIFGGWPGQWEVSVIAPNRAALVFWRNALVGAPGVGAISENDLCDPNPGGTKWDGTVLRFRTAAAVHRETTHVTR